MIKRFYLLIVLCACFPAWVHAQEIYVCRGARISFFSSAPIEDITAETDSAVSAINLRTGSVYFKVLIRSFQFERPLMQEHFNSHYLQSDQYPDAEFRGKILYFRMPDTDGIFPVTVAGDLTIHGVTKAYEEPGVLELKAGELAATSTFNIHIADHGIKIPKLLVQHIAEVVAVKVNAVYDLQDLKQGPGQEDIREILPQPFPDSIQQGSP